jgi:hypothetical protein
MLEVQSGVPGLTEKSRRTTRVSADGLDATPWS